MNIAITEQVINERLELLRDNLRQAAVHSPSARTRYAAEVAMEQPSDIDLLRVTQSLSCTYAPALRRLVSEYHGDRL
jgi:hypothetical protein